MHTIVGLGNPGKEYERTRHNVGWLVLGEVLRRHGFPELAKNARYASLISEGMFGQVPVSFLFPTTYMNNSGSAVSRYIKEKGSLDSLIVVHDDVDLPFGNVRISFGRGAGGHNGVQSIIGTTGGNEFTRIRVGIAQRGFFGGLKRPKGDELADFVLKPLSSGEMKQIPEIGEKVDTALTYITEKGIPFAMQECNK
jgi:PTH1 family peptidyl-tRNA hydrolase